MTNWTAGRRQVLSAIGAGLAAPAVGGRSATAQAQGATVYVGGTSVAALDAETGEIRWQRDFEYVYPPTVAGGLAFAGTWEGQARALDATTGEDVWQTGAGRPGATTTVSDGTVFYPSLDETLYALDARNGSIQWRYTDTNGNWESAPHVAGGMLYVGNQDRTMYALDPASGRERWSFHGAGRQIDPSPTVHDGRVYFGADDEVFYAVDAETGQQEWSFGGANGWISSSATAADGTVYAALPRSTLYAFDAATGDVQWSFETGTDTSYPGSPTVVDGVVYLVDGPGDLYAIDAATGDQIWVYDELGLVGVPTVHDGTVYVAGDEEVGVVAVDAATGNREWHTESDGYAFGAPTVVTDPGGNSVGSRVRQGVLGHVSGGGVPPVSVDNLRLVQTVENTRVLEPNSVRDVHANVVGERLVNRYEDEMVLDRLADPDLVLGRTTAPVFDVHVRNPDSITDPLEVTGRFVGASGHEEERTVEVAPEAVQGIAETRRDQLRPAHPDHELPDQLPLLDALVPTEDAPERHRPDGLDGDYPLFRARSTGTFELEVDGDDLEESVTGSVDLEGVHDAPPLTVGVAEVELNLTRTTARPEGSIEEFAEAIGREILEQFPVPEVAVAVAPGTVTMGTTRLTLDRYVASQAERHVNATIDGADVIELTSGGGRSTGGDVSGVDFTIAAVPRDFDEISTGIRWATEFEGPVDGVTAYTRSGRPWANACWVKMGMPTVAIHEFGHYLLGQSPFGEFVIPGVDGGNHTQGNVRSTAFRIQDGEFGMGDGRSAVMSGGGNWISSETYQHLLDANLEPALKPPGNAALDTVRDVLSGIDRDPFVRYFVGVGQSALHDRVQELADVDLDDVTGWYEGAREGLAGTIDGVDYAWQAPELPADVEWDGLDGVLDDRLEIGRALEGVDETFELPDGSELPGHAIGREISDATQRQRRRLGGVREWAGERGERSVEWASRVSADVSDGSVEVTTDAVATVDEGVRTGLDGDGDGEVTVRDADDAVIDTVDAGKEILVGQEGTAEVSESYLAVVPLSTEATELEVTVEAESGETVSETVDPTVDPIRTRVERMSDEAFEDPEARQQVLDGLDEASTQVGTGETGAVETTLGDVYRELGSALDEDYEGGPVDPDAVLARVEGQIQRRGGEAPDIPEEESEEGLSTTWLLAGGCGAAAVSVGYLAYRRREDVDVDT